MNLYGFVGNNAVGYFDYLGCSTIVRINAVARSEVWALIYQIDYICKSSGQSFYWQKMDGEGRLKTIIAPWLEIEQNIRYTIAKSGWVSLVGSAVGMVNSAAGLVIDAINIGTTKGSRERVAGPLTKEIISLPELKELGDCECHTEGAIDYKEEVRAKLYDRGEEVLSVY